MVGYRCYILDSDDHIVQAHDLDCETDAQAASTAQGLLARISQTRAGRGGEPGRSFGQFGGA
jgi:hypothetical protein